MHIHKTSTYIHEYINFFNLTSFPRFLTNFTEKLTKYKRNIMLKFKINTWNFRYDMSIYGKYVLTAHPQKIPIFFHTLITNKIGQLKKKIPNRRLSWNFYRDIGDSVAMYWTLLLLLYIFLFTELFS